MRTWVLQVTIAHLWRMVSIYIAPSLKIERRLLFCRTAKIIPIPHTHTHTHSYSALHLPILISVVPVLHRSMFPPLRFGINRNCDGWCVYAVHPVIWMDQFRNRWLKSCLCGESICWANDLLVIWRWCIGYRTGGGGTRFHFRIDYFQESVPWS